MATPKSIAKRLAKFKKPKLRSPNYPVVGLQKAVELIEKLNGKYGTHKVPLKLLLSLWEYNTQSGVGNQCVAALKAYGLADVEGEGDERKISLSKDGARIAGSAPDRIQLLKNAAVRPRVHTEILRHYGEQGLPADDLLKQYLVWERPDGQRFNPNFVDEFIKRFRATLDFAGFTPTDIIPDDDEEGDEESSGSSSDSSSTSSSTSSSMAGVSSLSSSSVSCPSSGRVLPLRGPSLLRPNAIPSDQSQEMMRIPITLPSLRIAWLEVPRKLTEVEFATLLASLTMFKGALVLPPQPTTTVTPPPQPESDKDEPCLDGTQWSDSEPT